MSGWNGLDLQTDFSETLGDTSDSFKARVLGWMNQVQDDICSRYQWQFLRKSGKKVLTTTSEYQNLHISEPSAPTLASLNGGSLTDASTYSLVVTFYQSSDDYETIASSISNEVTCNTPNLSLTVTGIAVSAEELVTSRRLYLKKDDGPYLFIAELSDNTTLTTTITADATSTVEPPDYIGIKSLLGNPWIESFGSQLCYRPEDELRLAAPQEFPTGQPEYFDSIDQSRVVVYPIPSDSLTLRFNYIRIPRRIFAESDNQPSVPIFMRTVFQHGVLALGYQYRERPMATEFKQIYEKLLEEQISTSARTRFGAGRIRDVIGNSDGNIF